MSDTPLPKSLKEAIPAILWGTLAFAAGFEMTAKFIDGQYEHALKAFILLVVLVLVGLYARLEEREMTPEIIIVAGAMIIVAGIWWKIASKPAAEAITWATENFEKTGFGFLDMTRDANGPFHISGFHAKGRNNLGKPISKISAEVRFGNKEPVKLVMNIEGQSVPVENLISIPPNATFDLMAPAGPEITADDFLTCCSPIEFLFKYDGNEYKKIFTKQDLGAFISAQNERSGYKPPEPKIEWRKTK